LRLIQIVPEIQNIPNKKPLFVDDRESTLFDDFNSHISHIGRHFGMMEAFRAHYLEYLARLRSDNYQINYYLFEIWSLIHPAINATIKSISPSLSALPFSIPCHFCIHFRQQVAGWHVGR